MPNRWLHDSLLSSQRWNDLGLAAQNFYVRLMLVVDDFGCFDGRELVIGNACYPTHRAEVSETLAALQAADMIVRYSNAGKPYIALTRWQNEIRGKRRFPAPPICNEALDALEKLRGKYNREIGWRNPRGTDLVSILLDAQMRPVVPQPSEWRLVGSDYAPVTDGVQPLQTTGTQPLQTMVDKPYTPLVRKPYTQEVDVELEVEKKKTPTQTKTPTPAPQHGAQALATAAPSTTMEKKPNGEIRWQAGAWHGVSEAQRLRWQDMFADISVPDQLDRAGAWLDAHPKEHEQIERDGSEHAFLVRWLLREVRPGTGHTRAKADA